LATPCPGKLGNAHISETFLDHEGIIEAGSGARHISVVNQLLIMLDGPHNVVSGINPPMP
jgi:hypothetical protein